MKINVKKNGVKRRDIKSMILAQLADQKAHRPIDVMAHAKIGNSSYYRAIDELLKAGKVKKDARSKVRLAAGAKKSVASKTVNAARNSRAKVKKPTTVRKSNPPKTPASAPSALPPVLRESNVTMLQLHGSGEIHTALDAVRARLAPVSNAEEKVLVLSELVKTMPAPIAAVLRAVIEDIRGVS